MVDHSCLPLMLCLSQLLFAFPDLGVAIRSGIPFELPEQTIDDLFKGTNTKKYGFKRDGVTLTGESRKDFLNSFCLTIALLLFDYRPPSV